MKKLKRLNPVRVLHDTGYTQERYQNQWDTIKGYAIKLARGGNTADEIIAKITELWPRPDFITWSNEPAIISYFGDRFESQTYDQIKTAARMPTATAAAIMPDGHPGYGLPIGGVLALYESIWPGGVGYDIGCRMTATIYPAEELAYDVYHNAEHYLSLIQKISHFGSAPPPWKLDHDVMHDSLWAENKVLNRLKSKAQQQLGTSGAGNHFVELVLGNIHNPVDWITDLGLEMGSPFIALVTHSGSRGTGHQVATHYQKLAIEETTWRAGNKKVFGDYSWLSMDHDSGREYWDAMQLMGKYAQANHHLIHDRFQKLAGISQFYRIENHHNFAWNWDGTYVHRKGATPAEFRQIGIIPGSCITPSFIVEGLGNPESLMSSSHGAGRNGSRAKTKTFMQQGNNHANFLQRAGKAGVLLDGVALDEVDIAYKDIHAVMDQQIGILIEVIAQMHPLVVRMGGLVKSDDGD